MARYLIPCIILLVVLTAEGFFNNAGARQADTLRISFPEFVEKAIEASKQLQSQQQQVRMAEARRGEARASRYLPSATATTAHGLIPGVKSSHLPDNQVYLDPDLRNDWDDWGFFNQLEISALQPIYTWGAINNAIKAAQSGVELEISALQTERDKYELQLFQLYHAKLLSMELSRIINDAESTLRRAERELNEMLEDGSTEIEDSDIYQFEIFKHRFSSQVDEVNENAAFIDRSWKLALGMQDDEVVILPNENFLDPIEEAEQELVFYQQQAIMNRPELRQISAARDAAEYGLQATMARNYPSLFLGISVRYAYAPNRPRQRNPFISNPTNTSSLTVGIGFQQSLNFLVLKNRTDRSRFQLRQAEYAKEAITDGITLDVNDRYKDYVVAKSRMQNTDRALNVSREWLRQEQLDYDIGFGDVLNLVDAVKANLELEAEFIQRIHDFNVNTAKLYRSSGLPVTSLYNQ